MDRCSKCGVTVEEDDLLRLIYTPFFGTARTRRRQVQSYHQKCGSALINKARRQGAIGFGICAGLIAGFIVAGLIFPQARFGVTVFGLFVIGFAANVCGQIYNEYAY